MSVPTATAMSAVRLMEQDSTLLRVAAGIVASVVLPAGILLSCRAAFDRPRSLSGVLSLSLVISSFSWPIFCAVAVKPKALSQHLSANALPSYLGEVLALTFFIAPLSTVCGLAMFCVYLMNKEARHIKIVSTFFVINWAIEIGFIYLMSG
jgi:hypothetical protein